MLVVAAMLAFPRPYTATFPVAPDGRSYVMQVDDAPELRVVDGKTGKVVRKLVGCQFKPHTVLFSLDGATVAASSTIGEVCLWAYKSGALIFRAVDADAKRGGVAWVPLTFAPDSRSLAVGNLRPTAASKKGVVSLWDTRTGRKRLEIRVPRVFGVSRMWFVNEGRTLRTLDASIADFDLKTGVRQGTEWPRRFEALSDDGSLAADTTPGGLSVWDVRMQKRVFHIEDENRLPIQRVVFSPDNRSLAVLRNRTVHYADTGMTITRAEIRDGRNGTLRWTSRDVAGTNTVCFSPDGRYVLTPDRQLRQVISGEVAQEFRSADMPALGRKGKWVRLRRG